MSNFPRYDTKLFSEIWEDATEFKTEFQASPFAGAIHYGEAIPGTSPVENYDDDVTLVYNLLRARFKNSPIANYDEDQWKDKVFATIWQYGPAWEKRVEIQKGLKSLKIEDIRKGSSAIYNHAYNPEQDPSTDARDPLTYINEQNATLYNKSDMDAYAQLWDLIATDVTSEFLNRFTKLFKQVVKPERTWIYINEE